MKSLAELGEALLAIDGRGYGAYKAIRGSYKGPRGGVLTVRHVQGDPFAAPSRVELDVPAAHWALLDDPWWTGDDTRAVALADWLLRRVAGLAAAEDRGAGSGKSGTVAVDRPGQEVLARSACGVDRTHIELRLAVGLPAAGRRVLGRAAQTLLCRRLPRLVRAALEVDDVEAVRRHVEAVADQRWLRDQLEGQGLIAFVGDGACLPRRSGVDDRPMNDAVAFRSPPSMVVAFDTPHRGRITGMGIPRGVTLVVGGGYHGKSTLLQALERGVYDHVPGDGRELVVSASNTVKIRAEDGRRVEGVDIRAFVSDLPGGRSTADFRTDDASGSTSQAASIVEALEAGAEVLLIDEDTAATNFMIRDRRMQALVEADAEPITPFIDRVRQLAEAGVSTVLVIGGSGDYLDVADRVVAMRGYRASERTDDARAVAAAHPTGRRAERTGPWVPPAPRVVRPGSIDPSRGRRERKIAVRDFGVVEFGEQRLDLSLVGGLVATSQLRAVAFSLAYLGAHELGPGRDLTELLDRWEAALDEGGLDAIDPGRRSDVAEVRRLEVAAALNRLRSLRVGSP